MKGAQSFRAASLRPASVALSRARRSKPDHAELVRSTYTLPSVQGVKTGDLVPSEARPGVVSSSVVRIALRVPSRENHGDLPSQQRAMSDLGAPGGTRPIPNGSKCHARARTTRDPAALRPFPSRTRPLARKPARARFRKRHLTSRPLRPFRFPPTAGPATNGATSALANLSLRPAGVSGNGTSQTRRVMPSPRRRSTARRLPRAARASFRVLSLTPLPSVPRKFRSSKIPQARLSRPSGSEVSPAPSAARTRKPRRKRYVATLPFSAPPTRPRGRPRRSSSQFSPRADDPRAARPEEETFFFFSTRPDSTDARRGLPCRD